MLLGGSATYADITRQIRNARHGGSWDQPGITSTAAKNQVSHNGMLGTLTGTEYRSIYGTSATFDGNPSAPPASSSSTPITATRTSTATLTSTTTCGRTTASTTT